MSAQHFEAGDTLRTPSGDVTIESNDGRMVKLGDGRAMPPHHIQQGIHCGKLDVIPAGTGDRDLYIRFGDLPEDGQSTDHTTGRKEHGVSVFGADEEDGVYSVTGAKVMQALLLLPRGAYLVSGERVGTGADGEPVIRDVEIECELTTPKDCGGFVPVGDN